MNIKKTALGFIICLLVSAANVNAQSLPDSLLSKADIELYTQLSNVKYEPILQLYRNSLTEENILRFASLLEQKVCQSPVDTAVISLTGEDAIVMDFVEDISNLPRIRRTDKRSYKNIFFLSPQKPRIIPKTFAVIVSKWLRNNLNGPIPPSILNKYIIYASTGCFISLANDVCYDKVISHSFVGPDKDKDFIDYGMLLNVYYAAIIDELSAKMFRQRIEREYLQLENSSD